MKDRPDALRIVHLAILSSILILGTVIYAIGPSPDPLELGALEWLWLVPVALAVFGAGFLRGRLPRDADEARVRSTAIIVWALAEGAALLGLVLTYLTGSWLPGLGAGGIAVFLMLYHGPASFR